MGGCLFKTLNLKCAGDYASILLYALAGMCILFLCARVTWAYYRRRDGFEADASSPPVIEGQPVATASLFPTLLYNPTLNQINGDLLCAICLREYEEKEVLRVTPCTHAYHVKCIDAWLRQHSTCPICRNSLRCAPAAQMPHVPSAALQIDIAESDSRRV